MDGWVESDDGLLWRIAFSASECALYYVSHVTPSYQPRLYSIHSTLYTSPTTQSTLQMLLNDCNS